MAEGFEQYHVPQQSRRDKLRETTHHHHHPQPPPPHPVLDGFHPCPGLLPLDDHSLLPPDFAANAHRSAAAKADGASLMAFLGGASAAHAFVNPNLFPQLNPSSGQDVNGGGPYAFPSPTHCYQSFQPVQDPNATGQSLSLTLSSSHGGDLNLPPELNLQKYDFGPCRPGFGPIEFSKSTVPLGPFTGYAFVLKGSRFLRPAQQLLEELCDMGRVVCLDKIGFDPGLLDPPPLDNLTAVGIMDDSSDGGEQKKKSRLLSMLDEVYKRYKQYYQQMQAAIAAFESVAGLSNAAPFANLALKSMSKHFKCLKNAITDQLQFSSKSHGKTNSDRNETQRLESSGKGSYGLQRPFGAGFMDPPVWRPQRGLPEHAVTVLRSWLFEHFLHPYPTDTDKVMLAKQTGLSRNQVSNWFINARVRLWKPMVEEIHTLETRQQAQNSSEQSPNNSSNRPVEHENRSKRNREDKTETQRPNHGPIKSPYDNLLSNNNKNYNNNNKSNNHQLHVGIGSSGGNNGVSLTLGLHQNGPALPDSYPIHAARRLGLDSQTGDEYVVSGFTAQDSRFRREVMDGQQIMHDFVG